MLELSRRRKGGNKMKTFTKSGADQLQNNFDRMCKQFAEENDIVYNQSHLTYGADLRFTVKFGITENNNEAWDHMVSYFADQGVELIKGLEVRSGRTSYTITGTLNPSTRSKYKIGAKSMTTGKTTYFVIDALIDLLK